MTATLESRRLTMQRMKGVFFMRGGDVRRQRAGRRERFGIKIMIRIKISIRRRRE
jgi:hypothetical protein